jgi:lipopolysaccharide transport system ATP-binding protein
VARGSRLRFHQSVELRVTPGEYHFNIGLASTDPESYRACAGGSLSYRQFAVRVREHCRVLGVGSFEVAFGVGGKLSHYGLADLPGDVSLSVLEAAPIAPVPVPCDDTAEAQPTVFHVTHWKAGSQWIHKILLECWPNRIIQPQVGEAQVRYNAIHRGYIYPTVYLPKQRFDDLAVPPDAKRFVVIRDLRDTLVSGYFSFKYSHPILTPEMAASRQTLGELDMEEGLLHLMDDFLPKCTVIQLSWLESGEPILKYEDLLENDVSLLEQTLIERCGLPVTRERLREAVVANRFESVTRGRPRGREDITAHERKGVAGDWRNHFTGRVKSAFKARYGGLLVATGYEKNLDW